MLLTRLTSGLPLASLRRPLLCSNPSAVHPPRFVSTHFKQGDDTEKQSPASAEGKMAMAKQDEETRGSTLAAAPVRRFNESLMQMQKDMDAMMGHIMGPDMFTTTMDPFALMSRAMSPGMLSPMDETMTAMLPVDVEDTPHSYVITAAVPGFSKHDVKASLSPDGYLCLHGEHSDVKEEKDKESKMVHSSSRHFSSFTRSFLLPGDAKADGIHAKVKDGMLKVTVPKLKEKKPLAEHKEIPIAS